MQTASPSKLAAEESSISTLLAELRVSPPSNADLDPILERLTQYLKSISVGEEVHWFCSKAREAVREAATFLLRLHAYDSDEVSKWKDRLWEVTHTCYECAEGHEDAKRRSRTTYLANFKVSVQDAFFASIDGWERERLLESLAQAGFSPVPQDRRSLAEVPHLLYHLLINPVMLKPASSPEKSLLLLLEHFVPTARVDSLPPSPSPGLVLLLFHSSPAVRHWADLQTCEPDVPHISLRDFRDRFSSLVRAIVHHLDGRSESEWAGVLARDTNVLWEAFAKLLGLLGGEAVKDGLMKMHGVDFPHLVTSHLHDTGSNFAPVLRCFMRLLQSTSSAFWSIDRPSFPEVVYDSIKDNPAFERLLESEASIDEPWFLTVFQLLLRSVWDISEQVFGSVFAKVVNFLTEELQHPRFDPPTRSVVMRVVLSTMTFVHQESRKSPDPKRQGYVSTVLSIQAEHVASVAFGRTFQGPVWFRARGAARALLEEVFLSDTGALSDAAVKLAEIQESAKQRKPVELMRDLDDVRHLVVNPALWHAVRAELAKDAGGDGIALLVHAVVPVLHIALDPSNAFKGKRLADIDQALLKSFRAAVDRVNAGLAAAREGFDDLLSNFALGSDTAVIHGLLSRPDFVHDTVRLILCPIEDVSSAAQSLVGQIADASERLDCFRVLILNQPSASIDGMCAYLDAFVVTAQKFPEACNMARWMVRCLADVVEVLCNPRDGLLTRSEVVHNVELPKRTFKLWAGMCHASELIFKHTPGWSAFYETRVMTDWMRDALIFVRELVANFRRFESGVNGSVEDVSIEAASPVKLSSIGRKIVTSLDGIARNLVAWLRLTDDELLHQSTELLCSLLAVYRRSSVDPPKDAIATIEKYTTGVKTAGKLTEDQLGNMATAIGPFLQSEAAVFEGEDDDGIQFVGMSAGRRAKKPATGPTAAGASKVKSEATQMEVFQRMKPHKPPVVMKKKSHPESRAVIPLRTAQSVREQVRKPLSNPQLKPSKAEPKPSSLLAQMRQDFKNDRKSMVVTVHPRKHEPKNEALAPTKHEESESGAESSEEEESTDEEGGDFATMIKQPQSPAKPKRPVMVFKPVQPQRRQVKMLETPLEKPVLARLRQRQEAERTQLRLKPEMGPFIRQVLAWDYNENGAAPPYPADQMPHLARVPDFFSSYEEYRRHFEPLLMYECWQGLIKSKEETIEQIGCSIAARHNVDDWLDLDMSVNMNDLSPKFSLQETDLLLMQQANGEKSILAKVQNWKRNPRVIDFQLRLYFGLRDSRNLNQALQLRTEWRAHKVFSFSTIFREYAALQALPYYDMFDDIMRPPPTRLPTFLDPQIKQAMSAYQVNQPQAVAILGALETDGFSLIQGPPGTGKTKTICGLVGRWLSARQKTIRPDGKQSKPKMLICAPSNAAIDEVAKRVKEGVRDSSGQRIVPNVIRTGADNAMNVSVKAISLDALINNRIDADPSLRPNTSAEKTDIAAIRRELDLIQAQRQSKEAELEVIRDNTARSAVIVEELKTLTSKRIALTKGLNKARDTQKDAGRAMDAAKRRFRTEVLLDADIICCTLSGAGHDLLSQLDFETVVIDEAAQSVELSSLIPLRFRARRCIMVGDPEQLPPTVLSQVADSYGYSRSLFVRIMTQRPDAVHLLSIQYRMHPEISQLSSSLFYNSKLTDGPDMATKTAQPWHANPLFGPFRFFDVVQGEEGKAKMGHSLVNQAEADMVMALYNRLAAEFKSVNFNFRIGVVTMYREQMFRLRNMFRSRYGEQAAQTIDFNTVDGFQGQEKDIIILSCVRAGAAVGSVGFLGDRRRTNVAITRARSSLFILGNAATLERSDAIWKSIVRNARERSLLTHCDSTTFRMLHAPPAPPVIRSSPQKSLKKDPAPPAENLIMLKPSASQRPGQKAVRHSPAQVSTSSSNTVSNPSNHSLKRKTSIDDPKRPPPALRASGSVLNGGGSQTRPSPTSSSTKQGTPIPIPVPDGGINRQPPKGNPSPVPGMNVPRQPQPPVQRPKRPIPIPTPSDSTTMFIPKKRPPPPNPAAGQPSNVRQRLTDDLRKGPQRPNGNGRR